MFQSLSNPRRFLGLLAAWSLLFAATPGCLVDDGVTLLAIVGVGVWGAVSTRATGERGRWTFLTEWLANGIGFTTTTYWIVYVVPFGLFVSAFVVGFYLALGGVLVRTLARRLPLSVSVCVAWLGAETLRTVPLPPLGLGWLLLGYHAADDFWLSGSARVWGVEGLSFVLAAVAGLVAQCIVRRRADVASVLLAGSAVALALALSFGTSPPVSQPGPRLMIVQPSIPQAEKQSGDRGANHERIVALTLESLRREAASGGAPVDLVCWGESMLQIFLVEPTAEAAFRAGIPMPTWRRDVDESVFDWWRDEEDRVVRRGLLSLLPQGTAFLTGAVVLADAGDELRPLNAVVLYDSDGRRLRAAGKRYLVPGAETMHGLERIDWVREFCRRFIHYVPEFVAAQETGVLELETAAGRTFGIAATVCFDNSFPEAFVEPLRRRSVDFHLIVTNEDWYRGALELDQMIAFSRVAAISTGRAVVRVANSGISCVIGPDGRELARLRVDGRDRSVEGALTVDIPVPAAADAGQTAYVSLRGPIRWLIGFLTLALWLWARSAPKAR